MRLTWPMTGDREASIHVFWLVRVLSILASEPSVERRSLPDIVSHRGSLARRALRTRSGRAR